MKKILTPNLLYVLVFALAMMMLFSCEPPEENYTYRVSYRTDRNLTDLTNQIEYLPNGGIRYTDAYGRRVERFGTFYIVKLK